MRRVLVCDDDVNISEIVALVLTDADWEVYTIPDCNNIIEKIELINPSVIFMDHKIPDEGGIGGVLRPYVGESRRVMTKEIFLHRVRKPVHGGIQLADADNPKITLCGRP